MFGVKQVVAVALWGGLAVCSAGCGGDRSGEAATTSTPPTPVVETPPSTLDPETEVEQAYLAFDAMLTRLRQDPNPADPEIDERTAGQTRHGVLASQTTAQTLGERAVFGPKDRVAVMSVRFSDTHTAVVTVCSIEDITIHVGGDEIGPRVTTYWTDFTLTRVDESWLVSQSEGIDRQEGEQPCDERASS